MREITASVWVGYQLAIYRDALQRIVNSDPGALDALRIAAKALGDANEFRNTGTVRWQNPLETNIRASG